MPLPVTTKYARPGRSGSPYGQPQEVPDGHALPRGMWEVECSPSASVELDLLFDEHDQHPPHPREPSNERDLVVLIPRGGSGFCFSDGWSVNVRGGTAFVVQVLGT